jgi:nitrogenase molybdenum-iron protein NifN
MYSPKLIGVATTCLAETIGEDIDRIIEEFKLEEKIEGIEFIAVSSPGYGGSQYEGYYKALRKTVEVLAKEKTNSNGKINIIAGLMTPADIRELKYMRESLKGELQ